jgi:anti-sigma regulatory factor (Ser/Thr protein kinase)
LDATTIEPDDSGFRHEALFYDGPIDFVDRTAAFVRDARHADEPVLVVVGAEKIRMLREELGADEGVRFADMADVGSNPARIIPAWRAFVDEQGSARRFRGIGEPIWPERRAEELVECERHEALLNLAFEGSPAWWLACPYDVARLPASVLDEARRNHPFVDEPGGRRASPTYRGLADVASPLDLPLPEPEEVPTEHTFGSSGAQLASVRDVVLRTGIAAGLDPERAGDLVLAAHEIAANSVRHGGGTGTLRMWMQDDTLVCEIGDAGRIEDPLVGGGGGAGRGAPPDAGFGLWMANQLCDLVQIRTFPAGSVVRLHLRR